MSQESNSREQDHVSNRGETRASDVDDDLEELQESIRQMEDRLDRPSVSVVGGGGGSTAGAGGSGSPAVVGGGSVGGRLGWSSMGAALQDLRGRLSRWTTANINSTSRSVSQQLNERLNLAELAHSTRTPLGVMQSELQRRRRESVSSAGPTATGEGAAGTSRRQTGPASAAVWLASTGGRRLINPVTTEESKTQDGPNAAGQPSSPKRRRKSHLVASRNQSHLLEDRPAMLIDPSCSATNENDNSSDMSMAVEEDAASATRSDGSKICSTGDNDDDDDDDPESRLHRRLTTIRTMLPSSTTSTSTKVGETVHRGQDEEEKDIASTHAVILARPQGSSDNVNTDDDDDDNISMNNKNNNNTNNDGQEQMEIEVVLDDEEMLAPETNILLSEDSSLKLDSSHRSILFRSSSSVLSSMYSGDPVDDDDNDGLKQSHSSQDYSYLPQVYSWGATTLGQSLYDDDESTATISSTNIPDDNDLEPVGPSSRIGRTHVVVAATSRCHTAVVTNTGSLLTCGNNSDGAVDPSKPQTAIIQKPSLLECVTVPVLQVSCGASHTAAVTATGTVLTWGSNDSGQLGHRSRRSSSSTPTDDGPYAKSQMPQTMGLGQRRAASVACGDGFTLVLTTRMQVLVSGLLTPTDIPKWTPTLLPELFGLPVTKIAAGAHHAVVVTCHGSAFAWGDNHYGQCGQEHPKELHVPVPIRMNVGDGIIAAGASMNSAASHRKLSPLPPPDFAVSNVACGNSHTVLVTRNGKLLVCGNNDCGQLGIPQQANNVETGSNFESISSTCVYQLQTVGHPEDDGQFIAAAAGKSHTLVLDTEQNVWYFGGQQRGLREPKTAMRCILRDRSIVGIAAGGNHSIAISSLPTEAVPPSLPATSSSSNSSLASGMTMERKFAQLLTAEGDNSVRKSAALSLLSSQQNNGAGFDPSASVAVSGGGLIQHSVEDLVVAVGHREPKTSSAMTKNNSANTTTARPASLSEKAVRELANRAEELLQSPGVLNGLFLDPMELDMLYKQVLNSTSDRASRQVIASAMERGMFQGLQDTLELIPGNSSACASAARLKFPESVRFLLLYLQCPLFAEDYSAENDGKSSSIIFDRRGDLTILLCEAFLGLSYEGYKAMVSWVTALYPREVFVKCLVRPLLRQLERGLDPDAGPVQRVVPLVVAVLQWLYVTSERAGGIAKAEDFWSQAIGDRDPHLAFQDLVRWKNSNKQQRSRNFFLCSHAFLFSPATKRNLLAIENEMEMFTTATSEGVTYNVAEQTLEIKPFWILEIEREHMLEQTFQKVRQAKATDLRKKLKVVFKDEEGVDAGGVTREFFQLLSAQLFDVNSGMWTDRFDEEDITWFNSDCFWNDEGYYLVGILVGLAVYNSVLLDVHFPPAVYRKLLGLPLGLEDMVDSRLRKSLQQLLDYPGDDVEDVFCLTFSLSWMDLGSERIVELKPGGADIPVTSENKEEYVRLYVKWLLEESIYPQYDAFERGFMKVMENSTLDFMSPYELELLVVGSPDLDFDALEANTTYEGYEPDAPAIQHFWSFLKNAPEETKLQFLRFSTGSSKAPIGGLGKLPFKIQKNGDNKQQLPTSHTCFNTLLLPDYGDDYDVLADRLGRAVLECEGFGLQ